MDCLFCLRLVVVFITLVGVAPHTHAKNLSRYFCVKFIVVPLRPLPSDDPPKYLTSSIGMKFVRILPGTFMMGSPKEETGRDDDEVQHKVTLSKGFYMGVHLVTLEQWQLVMGDVPSVEGEKKLPVDAVSKKLPVAAVSWEACQEFIKKLREKDKRRYRLPTEAEWEFCCRAGTRTPFHFGDTLSTHQANYDSNETTPVGNFLANAFGLHDMHGNLWQWCQDWYGDYPHKDVVDPQGPNTGKYRVLRGGSWGTYPNACRSASRNRNEPDIPLAICGFRVAFCLD